MEDRRVALKIIGAIGTTCAFPYAADELYGQHAEHIAPPAKPAPVPTKPSYFKGADFIRISELADLIIPSTTTPGAVEAGVPLYIDRVVGASEELQGICKAGFIWLEHRSQMEYQLPFLELTEDEQIALLTPIAEAVDAKKLTGPGERFFRAVKSMTADGYYTSYTGLVQELGYAGNTVLAEFPECVHEH